MSRETLKEWEAKEAREAAGLMTLEDLREWVKDPGGFMAYITVDAAPEWQDKASLYVDDGEPNGMFSELQDALIEVVSEKIASGDLPEEFDTQVFVGCIDRWLRRAEHNMLGIDF